MLTDAPLAALFDQGLLKTVTESLITSLLLLFVLVIGFLRGKLLEKIYVHIQTQIRISSVLRPETAAGHARINERLFGLLNELRAMRICVFQFHNGEQFMLSNHAWKLSCSHEVLRPGVDATQKKNVHLYISTVADVVGPMLDSSCQVPGAEQRPACAGMSDKCPHAKKGARRVVRFQIADMPCTLAKVLAEEQKVKVLYTVNLVDPLHNTVFGFIGIQFDDLEPAGYEAMERQLCRACLVAEAVEFFLTSDARSVKPVSWFRRLIRRLV